MIKLGVVILNYKTYFDTERLVSDLLSFDLASQMHIVVVDNCSPNESFNYLFSKFESSPQVSVIQSNENGGYAKGNNIGLRYLEEFQPKYVLILNNDIYFPEDVLSACIEQYDKLPNVGAISPVQCLPNGEIAPLVRLKCNSFIQDVLRYSIIWKILGLRLHKYVSNVEWKNLQRVDIIPGCFIFISYKKFKDVGYFYNGTFLFCEERFFYKQLKDRGLNNYIIIDKYYIHDHSHTIKREVSNNTQSKFLHDGYLQFTKKYRRYPKIKCFILNLAYNFYNKEIELYHKFVQIFNK